MHVYLRIHPIHIPEKPQFCENLTLKLGTLNSTIFGMQETQAYAR